MSELSSFLAMWLADVHLLACALLAAVLGVTLALRQPARRMALAKATLAALAALGVLCALPGWSVVHLLAEDLPAPPSVAASQLATDQPAMEFRAEENAVPFLAPLSAPANVHAAPVEPEWSAIDWPTALLAAHGCGSSLVVAWLACGGILARRTRRASRVAPAELVQALQTVVGDGPTPELLVNDAVSTPVALGWRRPEIILPHSLADGEIGSILAHEWAHIAHGDLRTLAGSRWLLVLLWPQPLFWLLRRTIRLDQEMLADAAAAERAGRIDYAEQLMGWARGGGPRGRAPRLAGAVGLWEGPSQLKRRIAALLDEKLTILRACSRRWRMGTAAVAIVAACLLSLITVERQAAVAQTPDGEGPSTTHTIVGRARLVAADTDGPASPLEGGVPNTFSVRCLDAGGAPVAGVKATLYRVKFRDGERALVGETDSDATGAVQFANLASAGRVLFYKEKSAAKEFDDAMYQTTYWVALRREGLATTICGGQEITVALHGYRADVKLLPAQKLSGRVTAPDGKPVAGALVAAGNFASMLVIEGVNAVRTDADGRYEFDDRPAFDAESARKRENQNGILSVASSDEIAAQADHPAVGEDLAASNLVVTHPDFAVTAVEGGDIPGATDVVMLPAATIAGRVVDAASGAPRSGMTVRAYSLPDLGIRADGTVFQIALDTALSRGGNAAATRTGADGRYQLSNLPAGVYDVWAAPSKDDPAQAALTNRGISAMLVSGGAEPTLAPDLIVGPGGVVRAKIVDVATGQPPQLEQGARVTVARHFVGGPRMQDQPSIKVPVAADGKFEFRTAPGKFRVTLFVYATGSESPNEPAYMSPDNSFAVGPILEVAHGEAVDATLRVWEFSKLQAARQDRAKAWNLRSNDKEGAIAAFTEFLQKYPDEHEALLGRARCFIDLKRWADAAADFERVLAVYPDDVNAQAALANLLATSPDDAVRDGKRAVQLAAAAAATIREQGRSNPDALTAALSYLAAAYAETGDFAKAVATQQEVIKLSPPERREEMEARLKLYESGKEFRRE